MGFQSSIDPVKRLVMTAAIGRVDFEGCMESMLGITADKRYQADFDTIVDLRQIEFTPSLGELHQFSEAVGGLGIYKGRMAIVVTSSPQFEAARQFSSFSETYGRDFQVFTGMRNALRWLGLPEDSLP